LVNQILTSQLFSADGEYAWGTFGSSVIIGEICANTERKTFIHIACKGKALCTQWI